MCNILKKKVISKIAYSCIDRKKTKSCKVNHEKNVEIFSLDRKSLKLSLHDLKLEENVAQKIAQSAALLYTTY